MKLLPMFLGITCRFTLEHPEFNNLIKVVDLVNQEATGPRVGGQS